MSSIGANFARTIVTTNTTDLINLANDIVTSCTGPNCNVSDSTRTSITQQLSLLSQKQSDDTIVILSIPKSSTTARNIYNSYLNLAASVSSVFNYQCGDTTNNSSCITNSSSVISAQDSLVSILTQPATNEFNHITVIAILLSVTFIAILFFLIFLLVGLLNTAFDSPTYSYSYQQPRLIQLIPQSYNLPISTPVNYNIPTPVSPF